MSNAAQAANVAIAQAWEGAPNEWKHAALAAIYNVAQAHSRFTTGDVWATGLPKPREPRAMGSAMRVAAQEGWCEGTNEYITSGNRTNHNRPLRVWHSKVYIP